MVLDLRFLGGGQNEEYQSQQPWRLAM